MKKFVDYSFILFFVILFLTSCARPLEDEQLKEGADEIKIELEGMVFPKVEANIIAPVAGELSNILIKNGMLVKKDSEIIKYNRNPLQIKINKIKAQISQKKIESKGIKVSQNNTILNNNKEILKNITYLYNVGAASLSELLEAQNNYASSMEQYGNKHTQISFINSELKLLEFDLEEAKNIYKKAVIKAGTEGFVTKLIAHKGQVIGENEKVGKIININKVIVKAGLASGLLSYVKIGQDVNIKFLTTPRIDIKSQISRIIPVVDPQFGRMIIEIELDNKDFKLQPDIKALVSISITKKEQNSIKKDFEIKDKKIKIKSDN